MHIILGGTGHVGACVAAALLDRGEEVTVVTREAGKAAARRDPRMRIAEADVGDPAGLRAILRQGRRAFLLNPPAEPSVDTDAEERRTAAAIVDALYGSGLELAVLQSTYGAQPGERCGDLTVLHEFEQALRAQAVPAAIIRAAYHMSNWDGALPAARDEGVLPTMLPADLKIPMAAAADIGGVAGRLMTGPAEASGRTPSRGRSATPPRMSPQPSRPNSGVTCARWSRRARIGWRL